MVWTDPVSQDIEALRRLSDYHQVPILAVHAPCLLITQRVWSTDPWVKLQRAQAAAEKLGATTVVVHPPFRWQRQYARDFVSGIWRMADETEVRFAVENMFAVCSAIAFRKTWEGFVRRPADPAREESLRSLKAIGFVGSLLAYFFRSLTEAPGESLRRAEYETALERYEKRRGTRTGNPAARKKPKPKRK